MKQDDSTTPARSEKSQRFSTTRFPSKSTIYRVPINYHISALIRIKTHQIVSDTVCFWPGRSSEPRIIHNFVYFVGSNKKGLYCSRAQPKKYLFYWIQQNKYIYFGLQILFRGWLKLVLGDRPGLGVRGTLDHSPEGGPCIPPEAKFFAFFYHRRQNFCIILTLKTKNYIFYRWALLFGGLRAPFWRAGGPLLAVEGPPYVRTAGGPWTLRSKRSIVRPGLLGDEPSLFAPHANYAPAMHYFMFSLFSSLPKVLPKERSK